MEKMTKQQAIEMVKNSFPTIFAKEDVIKLIESIQETESDNQNTNKVVCNVLEDLKSKIKRSVRNLDSSDMVDYDSVELSINYGKEISVDSIEVNTDTITDSIDETIDEAIKKYEVEEEENEEEENEETNN
jgi:hypothetical protein